MLGEFEIGWLTLGRSSNSSIRGKAVTEPR
jgi:hypothetical protein